MISALYFYISFCHTIVTVTECQVKLDTIITINYNDRIGKITEPELL